MNALRFYKVTIAILVVINITTLVFLWWSRPPMPPPHPGGKPQLAVEIGLTGSDKSKVDALEKEHHKLKRALMRKDRALHEAYFECIGTEQDSDSILVLLQENKREIEEMTFDFFDEVAGYCNADQKESLREFINTRLVQMGHHGRPRP